MELWGQNKLFLWPDFEKQSLHCRSNDIILPGVLMSLQNSILGLWFQTLRAKTITLQHKQIPLHVRWAGLNTDPTKSQEENLKHLLQGPMKWSKVKVNGWQGGYRTGTKVKNNCPGYRNRPTYREKTKSNAAMAGRTAKDHPDFWVLESTTGPNAPLSRQKLPGSLQVRNGRFHQGWCF